MDCNLGALLERIAKSAEQVVYWQGMLTACQAVGPESGGRGEAEKLELVETWLKDMGICDILRIDAPDNRVPCGFRPNLVARIPGKSKKFLWLFGHADVVPAGEPRAWTGDPWKARRRGDLLYGRGVEDNQQAIVCMLLLARALMELKCSTELSLGLVFMSDEENGSKYGLQYILDNSGDIFGPDDLYVVPDAGNRDANIMEIAEKAQLWLKFSIAGRQCHASTPHKGKNALLAGAELMLALEKLMPVRFPDENDLFRPAGSTFAPTRQDANDVAINIVPGRDVFYMDCRLVPGIRTYDVVAEARMIAADIAARRGVTIDTEVVSEQESSASPPDCAVARSLAVAVREVYGLCPQPVGIGGATVASFLRMRNLPAVVWACVNNTCHQPDENSSISATISDAMVFARMLAGRDGGSRHE